MDESREALQEFSQRANEEAINVATSIKRLSKHEEWPVFFKWLEEICCANEQAYVPGFPVEHTIFRNGCQQAVIEIKNKLKTNLEQLIKTSQKGN